jgi:hypothetical protein
MSQIDQYRYQCLGVVDNPKVGRIMLYRLDEAGSDFEAKQGDIMLGGGSGEAAALRIAIPEAFYYWTQADWHDFKRYDDICKAFWTPTQAYLFGVGYSVLGWSPDIDEIDTWLTRHVLAFLARHYPQEFSSLLGHGQIREDGSIFRHLTEDENVICADSPANRRKISQ